MPSHVKVSGSWEDLNEIHVRVSGTWEPVSVAYAKVSGTWEPVFGAIEYMPAGAITLSDLSDGRCGFQFQTDGDLFTQETGTDGENLTDSGNDWVIPESIEPSQDLWMRVTETGGNVSFDGGSDAVNSWVKVAGTGAADRDWFIDGSTGVLHQVVFTIEIATDSGGSTIVHTETGNSLELDDT